MATGAHSAARKGSLGSANVLFYEELALSEGPAGFLECRPLVLTLEQYGDFQSERAPKCIPDGPRVLTLERYCKFQSEQQASKQARPLRDCRSGNHPSKLEPEQAKCVFDVATGTHSRAI